MPQTINGDVRREAGGSGDPPHVEIMHAADFSHFRESRRGR